MSDDPRIKAAATVLLHDYGLEYNADHLAWSDFADPAKRVIQALDAADRAAGIARVDTRSDATVGRTARALAIEAGFVFDTAARWRQVYYRQTARAVLAALTDEVTP